MTLENIRTKLAEPAPLPGRHDIQASDEVSGWTAYLSLDRHDELSSLVWEMTLRRSGPAVATVQLWATSLTTRVKGLLESLKIYEIDGANNTALLRSDGPTQRDGKLFYYEIQLRGTEAATVRRFQGWKEPGQKRLQVAFALTNEVLIKLIEDLTAKTPN